MPLKSFAIATAFVQAHIILLAGFVPVGDLLPIALGALAITSMALSLVLAARWRIVDRLTGGPDRSYLAHRYLGFFALSGTLVHWALASSVGRGVFPFLADSAEGAGTFAAFTLVMMTAAAMVRVIPYHLWKTSHMLMGPIFLIAVYHTVFVAGPVDVGAFPWGVLAGISALGLIGWARTLWRKAQVGDLVTVTRAKPFDGGIDVTLSSHLFLPAFRPGQFARLAKAGPGQEMHPFTIAGGDATSRRFVIRAAGDWTNEFVATVKLGDEFRVTQGEGRFLPHINAKRPHQLWIAGGVGITPFLAALEEMEADEGAPVTLIYCIRDRHLAGGLMDIEKHTQRLPQLTLIIASDARGDSLTTNRLQDTFADMPSKTQLYLCGPEGLKTMATDVWTSARMRGRIHDESFDFRGGYNFPELPSFVSEWLPAR